MEFRLPGSLLEVVVSDLRRPHDHAGERVGFLFARPDEVSREAKLLLAVDYWPVPDDCYLADPAVGARINSEAIRGALQRSLETQTSVIHTHEHHWRGAPGFSADDLEGWKKLIPSFCGSVPEVPHGALVLSLDSAAGLVWRSRAAAPIPMTRISVVGFPIRIYEQDKRTVQPAGVFRR